MLTTIDTKCNPYCMNDIADKILNRFDGSTDFSWRLGIGISAAKQIFARRSIPARYGKALVDLGYATAQEVLEAAAFKNKPK